MLVSEALLPQTRRGTVVVSSAVTIHKQHEAASTAAVSSQVADKEIEQAFPPTRGAFRKGVLLSALLIIPGLSVLLSWLAREPLALAMAKHEMFATVAIFAGLPALLVFGGVGKNLARQRKRSRRSLILRGAALGAMANLGLSLLAAVPTATLPSRSREMVLTFGGAAILGALAGALLGLWIHYARSKQSGACAADEA